MRRISQNERLGMIALAILAVAIISVGFCMRSCGGGGEAASQPPVIIKEIVRDTLFADDSTDTENGHKKNSRKKYRKIKSENEDISVSISHGKKSSRKRAHRKSYSRQSSSRASSSSMASPRNFLNDTIPTE